MGAAKGDRPSEGLAHELQKKAVGVRVERWVCSACRGVYFNPVNDVCPGCKGTGAYREVVMDAAGVAHVEAD